jgi:hypothetical protein
MKVRIATVLVSLSLVVPVWTHAAVASALNTKDDAIQLVKSKFTPQEIADYKKRAQGGLTPELKEEIQQAVMARLSSDEYQSLLTIGDSAQSSVELEGSTPNVVKPVSISVLIDGVKQEFDQPPVIIQGTTLVPFRGILEALGAEVSWDPVAQTVTASKGGTNIVLTIDSDSAAVNGDTHALDVPAQIIHSRTMVPARFISESLGATVDWDADNSSVIIKSVPVTTRNLPNP